MKDFRPSKRQQAIHAMEAEAREEYHRKKAEQERRQPKLDAIEHALDGLFEGQHCEPTSYKKREFADFLLNLVEGK